MKLRYKTAVAILVGGHSSRMGRPKENIVIEGDGRTFLEKICDETDECAGDLVLGRYLSVRKGQDIYGEGYTVVEDICDDIGPLGGIISVLKTALEDGYDAVLFLACDMPYYDKDEMRGIISAYRGEDILWARTGGKDIQPLAGIYSTGMLDRALKQANKENYRLRCLGEGARTGYYDSKYPGKYRNINSI